MGKFVYMYKYLIIVYFAFFMNVDRTGFSVSLFCGSFFLETLFSARLNSVVVSAALMSFCKSWAFFSRSFFRFSIFLSSWIRYSSSATYRTKQLHATFMCKRKKCSLQKYIVFLLSQKYIPNCNDTGKKLECKSQTCSGVRLKSFSNCSLRRLSCPASKM